MSAKPTNDILVAVRSLDDAKECVEPLWELGDEYKSMEKVLTPGTRYFHKGPSGASTHHIRIVETGSELCHHYLLFRDYLRNHPDEARKYLGLKKELHGKFGRHLPMDAKTSYIGSVLAKASSREKLGH